LIQQYKLLLHVNFQREIEDFRGQFNDTTRPLAEKQLTTALEKIRSAPFSEKAIKAITNKKLKGVVRRIHVGGRSGYRLFYLCPPNCDLIIPFYLSKYRRSNFEYDDYTIEEIETVALPILNDFKNNNTDQFTNWAK